VLTEIEQRSSPIDAMFVMSLNSKEPFWVKPEAVG
jgi:heptaprenylglyceryl phosphate synthase